MRCAYCFRAFAGKPEVLRPICRECAAGRYQAIRKRAGVAALALGAVVGFVVRGILS